MNPRTMARLGAWLGVAAAVALIVLRTGDGATPGFSVLTSFALGLAWAGPFLVSLAATRLQRESLRAGVWIGGGLAGLGLAVLGLISLAGLTFVPGSVLLLAAGSRAARTADERSAVVRGGVITVAAATAAVAALLLLRTPACWELRGGRWVPLRDPSRVTFSERGVEVASGEGDAPVRCSGDAITPGEGIVSIAVWLVAGGALLARRRTEKVAPA